MTHSCCKYFPWRCAPFSFSLLVPVSLRLPIHFRRAHSCAKVTHFQPRCKVIKKKKKKSPELRVDEGSSSAPSSHLPSLGVVFLRCCMATSPPPTYTSFSPCSVSFSHLSCRLFFSQNLHPSCAWNSESAAEPRHK